MKTRMETRIARRSPFRIGRFALQCRAMLPGRTYRVIRAEDDVPAWRYLDPVALGLRLWACRGLIAQLARREVLARYRGSYLGTMWALITPLLTLGVFTLVFGTMYGARWAGSDRAGILDFATHMFVGIVLYGVFSECTARAPMLITGNPNYVKKTVFPLEMLPVSVLAAAAMHSLLGLLAAMACVFIDRGALPWTVLLLPVVYLPILLLSLGAMWFLAAVGVFLRDVASFIGVVVQLLFFLTPVAYPLAAFKGNPRVQQLVRCANPLAPIMENARSIVVDGQSPRWIEMALVTLASAALALFGYALFMKLKRTFADAI